MCAHAKFIAFGKTEGIGCVPMQNLLLFGRPEGIGCVPMQNLLLLAELKASGVCPCRISYFLAELKALGVCPCKIYCFWQAGRNWVCAHAQFIIFDGTEYIGGPVCTGTCMGARLCGRPCSCPCRLAWTTTVRERGEGVRGASPRVLHLLWYCATLPQPGPWATALRGVGPSVDTMTPLQELNCTLSPGIWAVHWRSCSAHCPQAVRQCIAGVALPTAPR